jgi:hypothetical protein
MPTIIFDRSATCFGADYHPERPARLLMTEAHLLKNRPDWAWNQPWLASEEEMAKVRLETPGPAKATH